MRVYFSAVGGVGIGPLAMIAHEAGYDVAGSDRQITAITEEVSRAGVEVIIGQTAEQIAEVHKARPIEWFVHSSAISDDHPELLFAKTHNIRTSKRDEFINELLKTHNLKMIAVAGTHGKTTTTAMIVWLMQQLKLPVSYSIGTQLGWTAMGAYTSGSEYLVYECDEYDRNFLHFHPSLSIITSLDYDHPDTYPSQTDYDQAFKDFASQSQKVLCWPETALKLAAPGVEATNEELAKITLAGDHNRRNAWLAIKAIEEISDAPIERMISIINSFPGSGRRFEKLAENIYTDYAHHPNEIRSMMQLTRELNEHVIVAYQPHQNARQHAIIDEYKDCFAGAEKVYWTPTYLTRENENQPVLTPNELISHLQTMNAVPAELNDELAQILKTEAANGKLVIALGAGPIDDWARKHLV